MPGRSKWDARRLILLHLAIDLLRAYHSSRFDGEVFGARCDLSLLVMSVAVGQLEGRPMSASKIANHVGIPRGTAIRKLDELMSVGLVRRNTDKGFVIDNLHERRTRWVKSFDAMERLVRQASTELSKLDT